MRLDKPRVAPLSDEQLDPETRERFGKGPILNIFRTLANHPALMKRWLVFGNHVLAKSTLPARERELLILRIGWLCRAGYEWGQHVAIGKAAGLARRGDRAHPEGRGRRGLERAPTARCCAPPTSCTRTRSSRTPRGRSSPARWSTQQLMDLVFTVGQYNLVSMALNTLGVQPEPGLAPLPRS